ncbi:MAG: methylmalonyl Co-A mutase-associated GTPase MeaB [Candidatus Eisenbacteria bacterium]|uniref:Methylmalonyl Co-A mutase-associated GTPase MeaB n=1 Tax=Eiseniibacteriota bacterium TaxID=2212470 RepID=A0A937X7X3_UNCEI|nr:methylmalonyl Co-A mutase-associated GTPase MeaB [Candidatus Eisenbacteria bacterium]
MATRDEATAGEIGLRARELADRLARGERRAIAQAISRVEDDTPVGRALLDLVFPRTGGAYRLGVTGPPGSGKSTLVHGLARRLRDGGRRVGVLAIDPTSPFTGGAILGDRVRMTSAAGDEGFFVRSMASRGSTGGVSAATYEASEILEAAGFDWILIETVGVGQAELEVVELTDCVLLVLVPESGDAVQVMKAGIMEIADLFVINKFDREGGDRLQRDLMLAMELSDWRRPGGWTPPVVPAVALREEGLDEILARAEEHRAWLLGDRERLREARAAKLRKRMEVLLNRTLIERTWRGSALRARLDQDLARIAAHELSPYQWVEDALSL